MIRSCSVCQDRTRSWQGLSNLRCLKEKHSWRRYSLWRTSKLFSFLVVNGVERRVVNSFYISGLKNMQCSETYKEENEVSCDGSRTGQTVKIYKFRSPNRFFINYDFSTQRTGGNYSTERLKAGSAFGSRPLFSGRSRKQKSSCRNMVEAGGFPAFCRIK